MNMSRTTSSMDNYIPDCPQHDGHDVTAEQAYRRGYYQGYHHCLEDVSKGHMLKRYYDFLFGRLYKWRYGRNCNKWIQPPELNLRQVRNVR